MEPAFTDRLPILAASGLGDVFVPLILVMAGLAVLIGLVAAIRKRMFHAPGGADAGLSLGGLRDLVRQGKMTQEEYDAAKAQIVAAAQRRAERDALEVKPAPPPDGPPGGRRTAE